MRAGKVLFATTAIIVAESLTYHFDIIATRCNLPSMPVKRTPELSNRRRDRRLPKID